VESPGEHDSLYFEREPMKRPEVIVFIRALLAGKEKK
jgi:hypothetical protein